MARAFNLFELCEPVPESGCWIWLRAWNPDGYGKCTTKVNGELFQRKAHRFVYEQLVGPIPEDMVLCHRCNTRICVDPDHLYVGTQRQNIQQAVKQFRKGKLSREEAQYILDSVRPPKILSKQFGVSTETINAIKHGRSGKTKYLRKKDNGPS